LFGKPVAAAANTHNPKSRKRRWYMLFNSPTCM
jgi:hypothetical protein